MVARSLIALSAKLNSTNFFTRPMADLQDIEKLEATLWEAADNLRANSHKSSSEYCMPVLGVIFLRHATNRYDAAYREIASSPITTVRRTE
jgi:type I restriction-modification system DNA methylase subunit